MAGKSIAISSSVAVWILVSMDVLVKVFLLARILDCISSTLAQLHVQAYSTVQFRPSYLVLVHRHRYTTGAVVQALVSWA